MTKRTLEIIAFWIALLIAALAISAWLSSRDEQQRLAATLAAQKQVIDTANSNESARNASLQSALAQIDQLKRATQAPEEILRALPKYLPLPQPITIERTPPAESTQPEQGTATSAASLPPQTNSAQASLGARYTGPGADARRDAALPKAVAETLASQQPSASPQQQISPPGAPCDSSSSDCSAQIPAADLKPLFDYVQNCRACQAQLAAAKQDAADDASKIAALTKERDAAVTAAKGGSFLRRLRRNAIWFAVGAAAGYVAAKR